MATKLIKQLSVLRKILEEKEILFGAFSTTITKTLKQSKWCEIRDLCVSCGLITHDKDWTYIRDTTWPNIRKGTMVSYSRELMKVFKLLC